MTPTPDHANAFDQVRAAHHQIGNSLQSVASLLMLQARSADTPVAAALNEATRRVRVIIRLHQRLQTHEQGVEVHLDEFLADICRDVAEIDGREGANLVLDMRPLTASAGLASALGLITAELVGNAFEHGLAGRSGTVDVLLEPTPEGCRLAVSDDGVGFPDAAHPEANAGFGLSLIARMVRETGGALAVKARNPGVQFEVRMPGAHPAIDALATRTD